jgi:hypothetical protein
MCRTRTGPELWEEPGDVHRRPAVHVLVVTQLVTRRTKGLGTTTGSRWSRVLPSEGSRSPANSLEKSWTALHDVGVTLRRNPYEEQARDYLTPLLGPLRVIDRPGGPPGLHDFEADIAGGLIAAIEVTGEVDAQRLSQASAAERRFSSLTLPRSSLLWLVGLTADARVNEISAGKLCRLLSDLESQGLRNAQDIGDYRDPFVARLVALRIESVHGVNAKVGHEGTVIVRPGTYGGWGWDGPTIDAWLDELLASDQGVNKLSKLGRAVAAERHLVIVLDSFSPAGVGIPLGLTARHERGAADYATPSLVPPEPLTHLWIIPPMETWDGLRWTRGSVWTALSALRTARVS